MITERRRARRFERAPLPAVLAAVAARDDNGVVAILVQPELSEGRARWVASLALARIAARSYGHVLREEIPSLVPSLVPSPGS